MPLDSTMKLFEQTITRADDPNANRQEFHRYCDLDPTMKRRFKELLLSPDFVCLDYTIGLVHVVVKPVEAETR